ncbi:C4b-binding protein alpha chain-like [Dendropsophus ebraccatus]|uniref:C4b-binding protein alpha chain-like n=1 Tax=Dendropsophus ebraccatus TaxID=150705 RepID=UPI00383191D2
MHILGGIRGGCALLVLFLAHFTDRSNAQAALDMDLESSTLGPPQDTLAPCKGDGECMEQTRQFDTNLQLTEDRGAQTQEFQTNKQFPDLLDCEEQLEQTNKQKSGFCIPPPDIIFAKLKDDFLNQKHFPTGFSVSYECKTGYELAPGKKETVTCLSDGMWSIPDTFCKLSANFCGPPPRLDYGTPKDDVSETSLFPKGTEMKYVCRLGFVRIPLSSSVVTCLADSTWSLPRTFCKRRSCGNPGDVENGRMEAENFDFGSRVRYVCNPGYKMISKRNYRYCQENGKWSNDLPECTVLSCSSPPTITNGHYYPDKEEYNYLDSVKYACRGNLVLIGQQTISCTEHGEWSSQAPECKVVQCSNPNVENSVKESGFWGPYTLNSIVKFGCKRQYRLIGDGTVTCNQNSEWEPELPKCVGTCQSVPRIMFAELVEPTTESTFLEGTTLQYRCLPGYKPVPGKVNTAKCIGLRWSYSTDFCEAITCEDPEPVPHGRIRYGSYTYGSRIFYGCEIGYISKDHYRTCLSNGSWSLPVPECEVYKCPTPPNVKNGWYEPEMAEYVFNDTITYDCHEGFQLMGQAVLTCSYGEGWNRNPPECRGYCDTPPDPPYAELNPSFKQMTKFFAGSNVQYDCKPGYTRIYMIPNTISCLGNFTWSKINTEFCRRISCGKPPTLVDALYEENDNLFESEAIYKCKKGYKMVSESNSLKCEAHGKWSRPLPRCEVQKCSPPEELEDGSYSNKKDEYSYNDSVTYKCNTLQLVGKASVSCLEEGKWSSGPPQCKAVCTFPRELDFAVVEEEFIHQDFFDIGKTVQYKCRPGFVPVTGLSNTVTCLDNLTWSQHELFCTRISCGNPGDIYHGQMQFKDFLFGSIVNYTCDAGYSMLTRRSDRECQADGTWSGKPPVCKEPVCDRIWELQEEARKCTSTPDEWIKYLQVQYLYLQIENLKLDIEIKKRQLDLPFQTSSILHK